MKRLLPGSVSATVLLTGFDPFGGDTINPSWLVAEALHGQILRDHRVVAAQLPTEFDRSRRQLLSLLRKHQPALVLCLGLAGGRAALSVERIAINVQDARIADNAGAQPVDVPVLKSGPAAYFSTLPIKAIVQTLRAAGLPAEVSQSAGTFVCNDVFYGLMHTLHKSRRANKPRGGFMHLPFVSGQGQPCMALQDMVDGVQLAITSALATQQDIQLGAGALS